MYTGRVYSSKTNSWKAAEDPALCTGEGEGKFLRGKLHWLSSERNSVTISSFDLKSEVFGRIELPNQSNDGCVRTLGVVGGCLCLADIHFDDPKKALDVWMMKEYGRRESWEKLPTINLLNRRISRYEVLIDVEVIGEAANGEILIAYGWSLLVYCTRNGVIRLCRTIDNFYAAHLCVESLVSPYLTL